MNEQGRLVDIIVFCIAGFVIPMLLFVYQMESIKQVAADGAAKAFADNISVKGYVDRTMYEDFIQRLNEIGNEMHAELSIEHECLEPEYVLYSTSDMEGYLESQWNGENQLRQEEVFTEKPDVIDPGEPPVGSLTENVSGTDMSVSGPSETHMHDSACYTGVQHWHDESCPEKEEPCMSGCTKHTHAGNSSRYGGCYTGNYVSGRYVYCGEISDTYTEKDVLDCPNCGGFYTWWIEIVYGTCNGCGSNRCVVQVTTECDSCIYESGSSWNTTHEEQSPGYYELACGKDITKYYDAEGNICNSCNGSGIVKRSGCTKTEGEYYDEDGELCSPICNQTVVSLIPLLEEQVLNAGELPESRAKAVFADGHTEIVDCAADGFDSSRYNVIQTVSLTYKKHADSVTNQEYCLVNIKVMVRYQTRICDHGHLYYLVDGSLTPCPYCYTYPKVLTVQGADEVPFYIQKGTTLADNGITLQVTYYDGHTQLLSSGWTENLDRNYCGEQTVVISYGGIQTSLLVYSERITVKCPVCGYEYTLYPDNTDPGCPGCLSAVPVFTGDTLQYKKVISGSEISEAIYNGDGRMCFSKGDRLELKIWKNAAMPMGNVLGKTFGLGIPDELIVRYSTAVRDTYSETE